MTEDNRFAKIQILIHQERFAEAEKILADLLSEEPDSVALLFLLAEVHLQQDKTDSAEDIIDRAIGLSPDEAHLFFVKSRIALRKENAAQAESYILRAIELDPHDADCFAFAANIKLSRKQFEAALEMADRALEIDAENLHALNARSTALNKLDRKDEAFQTIEDALREDPNNAYTHANYGWGLLEKGDHKKALEHFKEALTHDPNFAYAQAGMLEALKAKNPVYRLFLKYSFWMSNMTAQYQWGVIVVFYIAFKGLNALARNNETLKPFLMPVVILLALVAFSTWIIEPVGNLFLRFNKYGQLLLDKKEKMSSNFVAVSFAVFISGLIAYVLASDDKMLMIAAFGFAMMLPLGTMLSPSKNKYALMIYTGCLAAAGLGGISIAFLTGEIFNLLTIAFILGFTIFQWAANYILIREDNL